MSCCRNFKHTFGKSIIGWLLPLPVVQDTGRFENMKEQKDFPEIPEYQEEMGVTFYSISFRWIEYYKKELEK